MKDRFLRYISMVITAVVVLTTVLQFHHHDCDGNIYIHLTTFDDLSLGHTHHGIEHCTHDHDCGHNDCEGESNCSMHLGAFTVSRQHDITNIEYMPIPDWACFERATSELPIKECVSEQIYINDKTLITDRLIFQSALFRAPPASLKTV